LQKENASYAKYSEKKTVFKGVTKIVFDAEDIQPAKNDESVI